jgi:hypothetical protein
MHDHEGPNFLNKIMKNQKHEDGDEQKEGFVSVADDT